MTKLSILRTREGITGTIAFASFIALGITSTLINVAWSPSIRETFQQEIDALGIILFASTIGSLLVNFNGGRIVGRFGIGALLMGGLACMAAGLFGYALAPVWWIVIVASFVMGMGFGGIDAGLNTYAATTRSPRFMNWLHASFGIGATLGPIIITALIEVSWRWGYVVAGVVSALLVLAYVFTRKDWSIAESDSADPADHVQARIGQTLRMPVVWLGIAIFVMIAGMEMSTAQWSSVLFSEGRGVAEDVAGLWIGIYWGSFTVGRIVLGSFANRVETAKLLRLCMVGLIVGTLLLWLDVANELSYFGLIIIGFSLAPTFPLLMSATPGNVGHAHAPNAIGFQTAAGGIGIAALPALAGVLIKRIDVEIVGPFLFLSAVLMVVLNTVLARWADRHEKNKRMES